MDALFTPHRGDPRFNGDPPNGDGFPVQVDFTGRAQDVALNSSAGDALTLVDFLALARDRIVWMDQVTWHGFEESCTSNIEHLCLILADVELQGGTQVDQLAVAVYWGRAAGYESTLALLATCDCKKVCISGASSLSVSAVSLSQLLTHSRNLKLTLAGGTYDEDHVRALDTEGRTDLQILYNECGFTDAGHDALLDSIQNNRGPTAMICCKINSRRLAGALRGNRSLKWLSVYNALEMMEEKEYLETETEFFQAIKENRGLEYLSFYQQFVSDDNWSVLCDSLGKHPTLEWLNLALLGNIQDTAQKTTRMRSLLKMLQFNTRLDTIQLNPADCDMHIYTNAILPRLKNTPQFRSVSQTRGVLRSKLLGRALYSVNDNPTLLWMFLSSNVPAAFAGKM
jgi:hypothetical protein